MYGHETCILNLHTQRHMVGNALNQVASYYPSFICIPTFAAPPIYYVHPVLCSEEVHAQGVFFVTCVLVRLYRYSNHGPLTIEDNRDHDCQ